MDVLKRKPTLCDKHLFGRVLARERHRRRKTKRALLQGFEQVKLRHRRSDFERTFRTLPEGCIPHHLAAVSAISCPYAGRKIGIIPADFRPQTGVEMRLALRWSLLSEEASPGEEMVEEVAEIAQSSRKKNITTMPESIAAKLGRSASQAAPAAAPMSPWDSVKGIGSDVVAAKNAASLFNPTIQPRENLATANAASRTAKGLVQTRKESWFPRLTLEVDRDANLHTGSARTSVAARKATMVATRKFRPRESGSIPLARHGH